MYNFFPHPAAVSLMERQVSTSKRPSEVLSMALAVSRLHLSPTSHRESSRPGLLGGAHHGREVLSKPLPYYAARQARFSSGPRFLAALAFERWYRANIAFRVELGGTGRLGA